MNLIAEFSVKLKEMKAVSSFENKLLKNKEFSLITSYTHPVSLFFKEIFSQKFSSTHRNPYLFLTFQNELIKEKRLESIFSFETSFKNLVMLDLDYFKKIYSYNKNLVDNMPILFKKFQIYCDNNGIEVTDDLFSSFLTSIDQEGVVINE